MKSKVLLSEQAYQILKQKILSLELLPDTFVTEQELCELTHLGRMPVKESLNKLEQMQLLKIVPRKGIVIAPIEWNGIFQQIEIYRYLRVIQYKWVAKTITEVTRKNLQEIRDELYKNIEDKDYQGHIVTAEKFHKLCHESCQNAHINHAVEPLRLLQKRIFNKYLQAGIGTFEALQFTRCQLIDAIMANDSSSIHTLTMKIFDETEISYRKIYANFL